MVYYFSRPYLHYYTATEKTMPIATYIAKTLPTAIAVAILLPTAIPAQFLSRIAKKTSLTY